jgi:hypothetical protein
VRKPPPPPPPRRPAKRPKLLQGERIETPQYAHQHGLKIDFSHYVTTQIMEPVIQLFLLGISRLPFHDNEYFSTLERQLQEQGDDKCETNIRRIRKNILKMELFRNYCS